MKKLVLSFFIVLLLVACTPAITETPTPTTKEVKASTPEQLYGIWYIPEHHTFWEFSGDSTGKGTAKIYTGLGDLYEIGDFSIKDGILSWGKSENHICNDVPAAYEITLILENNSVVGMRPTLIGDDACFNRKNGFGGNQINHVAP